MRALTPADLRRRSDEWDVLVRAAARPSPFLLAGYVAPWVEHLAAAGEPVLLAAEAGGRIVGGLPLVVHRRAGLRTARWVGGVEATPADLLLAPDAPAATVAALRSAAAAAADLVQLAGLPADPIAARTRFADAGGADRRTRDGYRPGLGGRLRRPRLDAVAQDDRKRRRRLEESGALEVVVARDAASVSRYLPEALAVHASRWAHGSDGSTFGTDAGRRSTSRPAPGWRTPARRCS